MLKFYDEFVGCFNVRNMSFSGCGINMDIFLPLRRKMIFPCPMPLCFVLPPRIARNFAFVRPMPNFYQPAFGNRITLAICAMSLSTSHAAPPLAAAPLGLHWGMTPDTLPRTMATVPYRLSPETVGGKERVPNATPGMDRRRVSHTGIVPGADQIVLNFYQNQLCQITVRSKTYAGLADLTSDFNRIKQSIFQRYVIDKVQENLYLPLPNVYFSHTNLIAILSAAPDPGTGGYYWHLYYRYTPLDPYLKQAISKRFHPDERYQNVAPISFFP